MTSAISREQLEEGARRILLSNLREGVADWNGKEFSFVCPSLTGYPFQWFWDSCFHALALLHLDPEQAKKEMRSLMSGAQPSGFIPHIIFWEMEKQPDFLSRNIVGMTEPYYSATIQPPIIAYAVARVYRVTGDEEFLREALPILTRYYRYLREARDPDNDGLIAVIQPEEAGTDCSPKYDEILGLEELSNRGFITALRKVYEAYEPLRHDDHAVLAADIFHVEDVLVNSIYCFCLRALARLHTEVGRRGLARGRRVQPRGRPGAGCAGGEVLGRGGRGLLRPVGRGRKAPQDRHHQLAAPPDAVERWVRTLLDIRCR